MSSLTPTALENLLGTYGSYYRRVKDDVYALIGYYKTLIPKEETYVSNDGQCSTLLLITGFVPVAHQGISLPIPLDIWVPKDYPQFPPMCFVRATKEFSLNPSHPITNSNGELWSTRNANQLTEIQKNNPKKAMLPYLGLWSDKSHLFGLVNGLACYWSQELPVFPLSQTSTSAILNSEKLLQNENLGVKQSLTSEIEKKVLYNLQVFRDNISVENQKYRESLQILERNSQFIDHAIQVFRDHSNQLDATISLLDQQNSKMQSFLSKEIGMAAPNGDQVPVALPVDQMLRTESPRDSQLMEVVAEEHALEDCLYYLSKSLQDNKIDLETYLKTYRSVCREQYLKRALISKILESIRTNPYGS